MRLGRRIGIDYGAARIGVACSTVDALISSPLTTVLAGDRAIQELIEVIREQSPIEVYVGLPLNLNGDFTKSTSDAIELARGLEDQLTCPVRMVDERMSTRAAQGQLFASGKNSKTSRSLIDAAAASLILEGAIAFEKSTGNIPGKLISELDA
jgi:putative Holliday junction resolvase